ncbi:MAG: hypothetical protein JNK84_21835 [Phreatobacter sp.]|uniref:hypothetical protein n=1 Tax=Phreatobacter sp. TaxID=1966341 RepID=UPI001A42BDBC|nr:hypothetical protein [Phreatobacter sp.]MBL8571725.1 hypothetical protein [Phreatobacter sp.]
MTKLSASAFSDVQQETLRAIAGAMIPPCEESGLPGANDAAIVSDILASTGRDTAVLIGILDALHSAAGGNLDALRSAGPGSFLATFRSESPALAGVLELAIAQCYYRDDRVLRVIGMEPRPPFPKGYEIEEGDWSLLDPVRARGKIYRDADEGRAP